MKRFLVTITLFLVLVGSVFAKPTKVHEEYTEDAFCIFWQLESIPENSNISVITTSFSAMDILEVNENGKIINDYYKVNISNSDLIYLIAKYGYVIIDVPNEGRVLETELDFGYVAFELDCED